MEEKFDLSVIEAKIKELPSIKQRLDYWLDILNKYVNEPLEKEFGQDWCWDAVIKESNLINSLWGSDIYTILDIPKKIYNTAFREHENSPEFTYWFLKYEAEKWFTIEYKYKTLEAKSRSKDKRSLKAELNKIKDFEKEADKFLMDTNIDIWKEPPSWLILDKDSVKKNEFIEYLRIKEGYYVDNALCSRRKHIAEKVYARCILLKKHLEKKLAEKNIKNVRSFTWPKESRITIEHCHKTLIACSFISDNDYENFELVFSNKPCDEIKPIWWKESNKLLAYFFDSVFPSENWQSIIANGKLFKNSKGNILNQNSLSQAIKQVKDFGLSKGKEKIDELIKDIKKH